MRRLGLVFVVLVLAGTGWAGPKGRSFESFRKELVSALKRKDGAYVLRISAPDITWSFGDTPGRKGFARASKLPSKSSEVYGALLGLLAKGSEKLEGGIVQVPRHAGEGLRAGFERRRGKWTMIYFVAGD